MATLQRNPAATSFHIPATQQRSKTSGRRPLQPVNSAGSGIDAMAAGNGITKGKPVKHSLAGGEFGKENEVRQGKRCCVHPEAAAAKEMEEWLEMGIALSLEEELMAARKKMERMRIDRERTERLLDERLAMLDAKMRELDEMGEVQKLLEMEVDRLYRLKQLKSTFASKVTPMRSLREMEQSRKSEAGSEATSRIHEINFEESPRSSVASAKSISMEE